jgi:hypothetical protein
MIINEVGQQNNTNVDGDFKFDEFPQGYYYASNFAQYEYPGVEAWGDFHSYFFYDIGLTVTAPVDGLSNPPIIFTTTNTLESYNANFSTAADEYQIIVSQSSTGITAENDIISSSGTILAHPTQTWPYPSSGHSNPPPYTNYGVSDELVGLELYGNAHMLSGTDFQIESVVHLSTDFTGYTTQSYTQTSPGVGSLFTIPSTGPPCFTTWSEDEATDATYTYYTYGTTSNEAYQIVEVT